MSITVTVENDTIKLPVHVPDGTQVEVTLPGESAAAPERRHAWMQTPIGAVKDGPGDLPLERTADEKRAALDAFLREWSGTGRGVMTDEEIRSGYLASRLARQA